MRQPVVSRRDVLASAATAAAGLLASASATRGEEQQTETGSEARSAGLSLVRDELAQLLDGSYSSLETGYRRLEDGQWMVAALHRVSGLDGRMIEWWHRRRKTLEEFKMWHPSAHVYCAWDEERQVNVYHHEFGGVVQKSKGQPRDTADYFDTSRLAQAGVSAAICSRGGPADLDVWGLHVVHVCRDTEYGCEVRTRLFVGDFEPAPPEAIRRAQMAAFNEETASRMLRHTIEEHEYLAGFLPALYEREHP